MIPCFFPKLFRLFGLAGFPFEYRHAPNGVRQVEPGGLRMAAIESEGFVIAGLGQFGAARVVMNIAEMADGVSQSECLTFFAADRNGLLIVPPRGVGFMQVPLDLSQASEDLCQLSSAAILPKDANSLGRIPFGVGKLII